MVKTKATKGKIFTHDKLGFGRTLGLAVFVLSFFLPSLSHAGYGNFYLVTGSEGVTLNNSLSQMSYRFTVQSLNAVSIVQLYVQAMGAPVTYDLALQGDIGGIPSGTDLVSQTFVVTSLGWNLVVLPSNTNLVPGNTYHLIVRPGTFSPNANSWAAFASTLPLNNLYPYDGSPDPHADVMVYNSSVVGWGSTQTNPVYILTLNSVPPISEGVPYALSLWKSIDGNGGSIGNWVSQKFTYLNGSSALFDQVRVYLRVAGVPNSPLNCELRDETGSPVTVATGNLQPSALTGSAGWFSFNLSPAFSFVSNHVYRLAFYTSSGSPNTNAYQILVDNAPTSSTIQTSLTFQGSSGIFGTSYGGTSWIDDFASDAPFEFVPAPPTPTPTPGAALASPTPTPKVALTLDQNFFNPSQQPLGMDLRVAQAGQVKIAVFNIVGEEVKVIQDASMPVGNYRVSWDGRNKNNEMLGNAVYFIMIQQTSGNMIRKVIVLK